MRVTERIPERGQVKCVLLALARSGRFWLAVIYTFLLTGGMLLPKSLSDQTRAALNYNPKIAHMIVYGVFAAIVVWGLKLRARSKGYTLWTFLCIAVYGILIEVLQLLLLPGRSFSIVDAASNIAGAVVALLVYFLVVKGIGVVKKGQ